LYLPLETITRQRHQIKWNVWHGVVVLNEAWYRETMPKLKARNKDKTFVLPKQAKILSDLRLLRVVKGMARVPEQGTTDKTGSRHEDSDIAFAMLMSAWEKLGSVERLEYASIAITGRG